MLIFNKSIASKLPSKQQLIVEINIIIFVFDFIQMHLTLSHNFLTTQQTSK